MTGTWVWFVGLGLLLLIQNASGTCDVKFADGLGKNDKRIFVLGEQAELKCDVTAMDPTQDVLYWKYDEKVFSENNLVMELYRDKYNVSLGLVGGKKIYTLSFKVEADDVGKYNCTCGSGGIQYPVWVKVPCNEPQHVVKDPSDTSQIIIDYLNTNNTLEVPFGKEIRTNMTLDCKCTWPEVSRKFNGKWKCSNSVSISVPDGMQDPQIKPLSCYTGVGSVTFRYKDVIGSFNEYLLKCDESICGTECGFYIDEGQKTMPEPLMKIRCGPCPPTPTPTPPLPRECPTFGILEITLIVTGIATLICTVLVIKNTCKYWKKIKTKQSRCRHGIIIAVLAAVVFCVIGLVVFILRIANKLPDLEGNPIHPDCKIEVGSIVGFGIIVFLALTAIIVYGVFLCKKKKICKTQNCNNLVRGHFIPCGHSEICLSCAEEILKVKDPPAVCPTCRKIVNDYNNTICKTQNCKNPVCGYFTPCRHSDFCFSCAKKIQDSRAVCPTCGKIVDDYHYPKADYNRVNGGYSSATDVSVSSTLPQRDQQPVDARTSDFSNIQKNRGFPTNQNPVAQPQNRNTKYMDKELKNDYENVPPPLTKPTDKKTDQDAKLCNQTCKNPVRGYFTPCRHSDTCYSCAMEILKDPSGVCPTCGKVVDYYYPDPNADNTPNAKICGEPCKNPVDGYFPLCGHSDICSSCATEIRKDPHGVCPTPNCGMLVKEYARYSDANARGLWNQRV